MQVPNSSQAEPTASWLERRGVAETLACALAFLVYVPTLGFQFVYDDKPQIVLNPAIHAWRYWPQYFTAHAWAGLYPTVQGNYYRPLFLLWFRLNHALFGIEPQGWHLSTVLCHVAAVYLVFRLIGRLAGSRWIAFSSAALFALHPVHLESVAWVSGVTDPLVAIFLLASFISYWEFRRRPGWRRMSLALAPFLLALLEKETAIVLGPLVFAYAWLYADPQPWLARFSTAFQHALGFAVISATYLVVRARVLHGLSHTITPLAVSTILTTEPSVVWLYVRHLLVPTGLSGLYGLPYVAHPASREFLMPLALLLAFVAVATWGILRLRDRRLALFAVCWMVLPVIPSLWLRAYAEGDIAHDRYLYIPSIGFVLLLSMCAKEFLTVKPGSPAPAVNNREEGVTAPRRLQVAFLALLASVYALGIVAQEFYWASDLVLFNRAYRIAPTDNLISNDLATALVDHGDYGEALTLYSQVLGREPRFWLSVYNLGYTYYKMGRFTDAEASLRKAISINATDSDEFVYLGLSLWRQGRYPEAAQEIEDALQIRPTAPGYHFVLGMIRLDQHDLQAARAEFQRELQNDPENVHARQQLESLATELPPMGEGAK